MDTKKKGKKVENKKCFLAEAIVKFFPDMTYYEQDFKKKFSLQEFDRSHSHEERAESKAFYGSHIL